MLSEGRKKEAETSEEAGEREKLTKGDRSLKRTDISGLSRCLIPKHKFHFCTSNTVKSAGTSADVAALRFDPARSNLSRREEQHAKVSLALCTTNYPDSILTISNFIT